MYIAFINANSVPLLVASLPALFAKSSLIWPAILNLIVQQKERQLVIDEVIGQGSLLIELFKKTSSKKHASSNDEEPEVVANEKI